MFFQLEHIGTADYFKKETGENFNYPPHLHQSFELIYLDEGEMTVTVNEVSYLLKKGDALLIFPNQVHAIYSTISKHTLFIFSPSIVQSFFTETTGKLPYKNSFTLSTNCINSLKALSEHSSKFEMKGALYTACALFDKEARFYDYTASKENTLFKILYYIEENFQNACTVRDIAEHIGYNPEYISRFFKNKMGIPCNYYINARRLNQAAYLLTNSNATYLYCALESGFTSLRSFNRNFKKHFGLSPTEYKQTGQNNKTK